MDIEDINKLVPFIDPKQYAKCFTPIKKSNNLEQAIKDGVIKKR
jgi:hypothetical protein